MTSRESTHVRPAETDTGKEEQSKEEQKALTTKKHQYYSAWFVIILMVVGNVVTLASVENTGAGKIFMAGVIITVKQENRFDTRVYIYIYGTTCYLKKCFIYDIICLFQVYKKEDMKCYQYGI